ncbi:MAG: serine/threonine protein kinase [Planctomycetes bacterium]|nr:serine/threonine protein kinase [Planctomycetota bacterium]
METTRRMNTTRRTSTATSTTVVIARSEDLSGKMLGGYRLTQRLAQGGSGAIYTAQNPRYKAPVAVKIIHAENAKKKKDVEGLTREYEMGRSLSHPGILKYYDFGNYSGRPFMVMEYFPGRTFTALYRGAETCKAVRRREREIFTQMAEIVNYLHGQKIVHLDLKPDNFMLDLEGNQLKLLDFSVSERVQSSFRALFSFGGRDIVGTPTYMSPEHIEKKRPQPAMDIYSFGVMLYEYFAGRPPFVGATQNAVLNQILQTPPPPLSRFNPGVSQELEQLVNRMLAKKPEARPVSMGHFINTFNRIHLYRET